ncbi:Hypothetical predicted protein, partial [Pelobates cultripes]
GVPTTIAAATGRSLQGARPQPLTLRPWAAQMPLPPCSPSHRGTQEVARWPRNGTPRR